jgi:hypothetical protein
MRLRSILAVAALSLGLASEAAAQTPSDTMAVRRHLAAEISLTRADLAPVAAESLRLFADSTVLQGARMRWASYRHPDHRHTVLWALAAERGGSLRTLRTVADWNAAAADAGWRPTSEADLLRACVEVIRLTGRNARPGGIHHLFRGWTHVATTALTGADTLRTRLTPPRTERSVDGEMTADFWMIEEGRAMRYACTTSSGSALALRTRESIVGAGYMDVNRGGP